MKLLYPLEKSAPITQTFTQHLQRARENGWTNYNGGIDWGVPIGTPVRAAADGVVVAARTDATGYGTHVRIQHAGGYLTIYAHLSDYSVRSGENVAAGQVIGGSGNTGFSTGPHLHFELRLNGIAIDPAPLLNVTVEPPPSREEKPETAPGARVCIAAGWNLRSGAGISYLDLGTIDSPTPATLLESMGDWRRVWIDVWVHRDALQDC